nr:MFS transporter [Gammaproteobacteria bacterium]
MFNDSENRWAIHDERYDRGEGPHFWLQILLFTTVGQLCWNIENQWFTLFLNAKVTLDVTYTTAMTILSASLTLISSFLFGTISDRKGKRRIFISIGFILWGLSTILMYIAEPIAAKGVDTGNLKLVTFAAWLVVLIDGIMSFIGSIGYDSAVNVWINDHTTTKNKGIIGALLGIMPVFATIVGTVVGGAIIGDDKNFLLLFLIMGIAVILVGVFALIFTRDKADLKPHKDGKFMHQLLTPFRFKELKGMPNMKELFFALSVLCIYFISFNFYFVYLGTWAVYRLGFSEFGFGLVEGISMILGIGVALPLSKLIAKDKIPLVCLIGIVLSIVGLWLIYFFVRDSGDVNGANAFSFKNALLIISVFFFGSGEVLMTEACMIWSRGLFPPRARGTFEGVRCIFYVWVPMLIGTICGDIIIRAYSDHVVDANGMAVNIPQQNLFLYASFVAAASLIPLFFGAKY